jgi:hypothetical protein
MNTSPNVRERQVNVRMSDDEADRLDVVCRHYGLNGANLFRMLVQREYNALVPAAPPPAPPVRKPRRK